MVAIARCAEGNQYPVGEGVAQDAARAATLCSKSADLAVAAAQTDLGRMCLTAQGVPRDFVASPRWFQDVAIQSNANAAVLLGQQ